MSTCDKCGQEIKFRYVDGRCIPMHSNGYCGGYSYSDRKSYGSEPLFSRRSAIENNYSNYEKSFVNSNATCPVCGASVFFCKLKNGGGVFFDELGPPWTKHPCTDNSANTGKTHSKPTLTNNAYSWHKEGWRPFLFDKTKPPLAIEGNYSTKITGVSEIIDEAGKPALKEFEFYIKNFESPLVVIEEWPFHFKITNNTFELSTIAFSGDDILEKKYLGFKRPIRNRQFQLAPTESQQKYFEEILEKQKSLISRFHNEVLYNLVYEILYNRVKDPSVKSETIGKCNLEKTGFYFPIVGFNSKAVEPIIKPLHDDKVSSWRKQYKRYTEFFIIKENNEFFAEIEF